MDRRKAELAMIWWMPAVSMIGSAAYWLTRDRSTGMFVAFLFLMPIAFALVVVQLAGRLRIWVWSKPVHCAVIVNCGVALLLFFLAGAWIERDTTLATTLEAGIVGSISFMLMGTLWDIVGGENKFFVVYNRAYHKNLGPIVSALSYGFYYFGLLGFSYAVLAKLGHYFLVERWPTLPVFIPLGIGALLLPFVLWLGYLKVRRRKKALAVG